MPFVSVASRGESHLAGFSRTLRVAGLVGALLPGACQTDTSTPEAQSVGAESSTGVGGATSVGGVTTAASGGASVGGSSATVGTASVGMNTVGTTGSGVTSGGAGGTVAVGTRSTSGGAGGIGGSGQAGTAGTGSLEDDRLAAEVLDGFAILKPCVQSFTPSMDPNNSGDCCCEELAENENQHITLQFAGDPNVTYDVTLRVAGVAERYWHEGGASDATSDVFYVGGLPSIHGPAPNENLGPGQGACKVHPPETDGEFALPFTVPDEIRPEDGCYNGFNIFAFTVSEPAQSYYLNHTTDFDGVDRQPHSVYETDYTVTVPIQGQAQLDFYTIDGDHHQVTNNGTMSVPDLQTPQPYNGNFLELTVLEVTREN